VNCREALLVRSDDARVQVRGGNPVVAAAIASYWYASVASDVPQQAI
jgi:hypothetical protein